MIRPWLLLFVVSACGTAPVASAPLPAPDAQQVVDVPAAEVAADVAADIAPDVTTTTHASPWGPISGACGSVQAELASSQPSFLVTTWHFDTAGPFDPKPLRAGAKKRYCGPNAGGSSKCSEVMSMQLLYVCEGATTLKTETEVTYDGPGTITDWLATFGGTKVGVSVTRAYLGPTVTKYTADDAHKLLQKKLDGIVASSAHVSSRLPLLAQLA